MLVEPCRNRGNELLDGPNILLVIGGGVLNDRSSHVFSLGVTQLPGNAGILPAGPQRW